MEPSPAEEMTLCLVVRIAFVIAQRLLFFFESQLHYCSKGFFEEMYTARMQEIEQKWQ